jgi:hypothetical protein
LVVTGEDPCPIEVKNDDRCIRIDLETYQEEADIIIVQQVLKSIGEARQVTIISDDVDVFVLLVHHYHVAGLDLPSMMESPSRNRYILYIKATITKYKDVIEGLLPAHALSVRHSGLALWHRERQGHQNTEGLS